MKTLKLILLLLLIGFSFSCNKNNNMTQEQEAEVLSEMLSEIKGMANSETCEDATEWTYVSYGSKACGGPIGYIAYSTKINTVLFLKKVEEHRAAQSKFNEKWKIISDCSIPQEPNGVLCEDGSPALAYE